MIHRLPGMLQHCCKAVLEQCRSNMTFNRHMHHKGLRLTITSNFKAIEGVAGGLACSCLVMAMRAGRNSSSCSAYEAAAAHAGG